jgi:hypothetical protein
MYNALLLLALTTFFVGCSGGDSESKKKSATYVDRGMVEPGAHHPDTPLIIEPKPLEKAQGEYEVRLERLNTSVSPTAAGLVLISIKGDQFIASVKMEGLEFYSAHAQYIHAGTECPAASSDMNGDELIDREEGVAQFGKILIPLDGDVSAQLLDSNVFPAANGAGKYFYENSSSLSLLVSDLKLEDFTPEDDFAKLSIGERLDIEGRTVVIYGAPTQSKLPLTVSKFPGMTREASLPIACGKITRAQEVE